jgi:3',5'-cyclic-AMP phosphodiesterase
MNRRKFVNHIGWTGLGIVWTVGANGLLTSCQANEPKSEKQLASSSLSFIQISDTHIGFNKPANDHVTETLQQTIAAINSLPIQPAFVIHTGDITHLSKPEEFDRAKQILSQLKAPLFTLAGEHDTIGDRGKAYAEAFNQSDKKEGFQTWDQSGVHFISLTNVLDFGDSGTGKIGQAQLDLLARDLSDRKSDTPLVILSHIPLYNIYPKWGWGTVDWPNALESLSRFSAVTVLNGHIHQATHHTEGNIKHSTVVSTAYPLPAPGDGEKPGPVKLSKEKLPTALGYRAVDIVPGQNTKLSERSLG